MKYTQVTPVSDQQTTFQNFFLSFMTKHPRYAILLVSFGASAPLTHFYFQKCFINSTVAVMAVEMTNALGPSSHGSFFVS